MAQTELTPIPDSTSLRAAVRDAFYATIDQSWVLARYFVQISDGRCWRDWGFDSAKAWIAADFDGRLSVDTFYHYRDIAERVGDDWHAYEIWRVIAAKALIDANPDEAKAVLDSGATAAGIRREVAKRLPDRHEPTEYRTVKLRLTVDTYEMVQGAMNRARFQANKREPTDDDIALCLALALLNEPWDVVASLVSGTVLAGEFRCKLCGSWDASQLTRHHVLPRSHGGHEGPIVLLCLTPCHETVQPRWRFYAKEWGFLQEADAP